MYNGSESEREQVSQARYEIREFADGTKYVYTVVTWSRSFGKCNLCYFSKDGQIETQGRFKYWLKKNGLKLIDEEIEQLPKKV